MSCTKLGYYFRHLININKLHPCLKLFRIIIPYEFKFFAPSEKCTRTLILLFNDFWFVASCHSKLSAIQSELPASQCMTICSCASLIDIKFKPSPIKRGVLSNRSSIWWFKCQDDTQPPKHVGRCLRPGYSFQLHWSQLRWENSVGVGE